MEASLLLLDALIMLIAAYLGLMDDRRGLKPSERSVFRMGPTSTPSLLRGKPVDRRLAEPPAAGRSRR